MTKKELVTQSLLPYLKGEKPFGFDGENCVYYDPPTKACCAIGQWLKTPEEFVEAKIGIIGADDLFGQFGQECLQDEVQDILSTREWSKVQSIHDVAACNDNFSYTLNELEMLIDSPLPEIRAFLPKPTEYA